MIKIASAPLEADLSRFSEWLLSQGIYHRITEEGGEQVLMMQAKADHAAVARALEQYLSDQDFRARLDSQPLGPWRLRHPTTGQLPALSVGKAPLVSVAVVVAVVLAMLTSFGSGGPLLRVFLIIDPWQIEHGLTDWSLRLSGFLTLLQEGQLWRLISPAFLHFSVMHLLFNLVMLWVLGGQLEKLRGSLFFLFFFIVVAAFSNLAQLLDSGYLFGGLSGVVYGLVAYTALWRRHEPGVFFPPALLMLSVAWLVIGYTPFTEWAGLGRMANSAHLFGLLGGGIIAVLSLRKSNQQDR